MWLPRHSRGDHMSRFDCIMQRHYHFFFFAEKCEELLHCKSSSDFSAKNINALDFMYTRRLNESLTNDLVKLTML